MSGGIATSTHLSLSNSTELLIHHRIENFKRDSSLASEFHGVEHTGEYYGVRFVHISDLLTKCENVREAKLSVTPKKNIDRSGDKPNVPDLTTYDVTL